MFRLRTLRENFDDDDHFQNYEGGDTAKAPAAAADTEATPAAAAASDPLLDSHGNIKVEPHPHV